MKNILSYKNSYQFFGVLFALSTFKDNKLFLAMSLISIISLSLTTAICIYNKRNVSSFLLKRRFPKVEAIQFEKMIIFIFFIFPLQPLLLLVLLINSYFR
jgi:hypothetical protein